MSSGSASTTGPPRCGRMERVAQVLGNTLDALDLRHPLRHLTVHAPVIHLLEGFAIREVAPDLPDEHQHRRGVLERGVHAYRAVGGAGSACHEEDPRLSGELAVGFGHVRCTALLAADDELQPVAHVVEAVEHRQIALARHTEHHPRAMSDERVGQNLAAVANCEVLFHRFAPSYAARRALQHSLTATFAVSSAPPISRKPCTISGKSRCATCTPSRASRSAYALPSSTSGSNPAVISSVGGSPARLGASRGDARQSLQSSRRGRYWLRK